MHICTKCNGIQSYKSYSCTWCGWSGLDYKGGIKSTNKILNISEFNIFLRYIELKDITHKRYSNLDDYCNNFGPKYERLIFDTVNIIESFSDYEYHLLKDYLYKNATGVTYTTTLMIKVDNYIGHMTVHDILQLYRYHSTNCDAKLKGKHYRKEWVLTFDKTDRSVISDKDALESMMRKYNLEHEI